MLNSIVPNTKARRDLRNKKPHIWPCKYRERVYWRVSPMPKPWNPKDKPAWQSAHDLCAKLNNRIAEQLIEARLKARGEEE